MEESFPAETNSTDLFSQSLNEPHIIFSMVILSLTFLLGLPANGLVLWIAGLKMQRTVNTVWFLHLTVADFLCCLSLPFSLVNLALQGHWPYGWFLCKLIPSVIILNMFASVFLLTAISLDRCLVVLKPIWCQNHRDVKTAFAICGCIWVVAFLMCIPVFLYRKTYTEYRHSKCGYRFDFYSSLDYQYFTDDLLENEFLDNSIDQLPGEMEDSLDSSSQTNDHPWTATTINPLTTFNVLHSQIFRRPSEDSLPTDVARLSSQDTDNNLFKPADMVSPRIPSGLPGFPSEENRTDPLDPSDALHSTGLVLSPSDSSYFFNTDELPQGYQNLDQFTYHNQVSTPSGIVTITRLVMGFLLPFIIIVVCYTLIILRMRRSRFTKPRGKTLRVTMVVVLVFLLCWTPYHFVGVLLLFTERETPFGRALLSWDHVAIALASANSCFNPFLYALLGKAFRKKARQSMQGILEAAFSEELTRSTSCPPNKVILDENISTTV
ncbi:C3a anaphylatoxin chemotactic receptor [Choloepus didactylus]|uniref:C3a anaphylatoxin chemotactic receptor n=1 Tax=Choloepus didactylus TaxID=27675 RepID=UPI0018A0A113|nr:C3a anaphylatoxin chemotactic receptor [Choloepus didactylus]XP_037701023.1 C3a anaphylatoxin chemotactic receptor [Choloepus didactylus]XP_037701024.1 C3a anaphylatoxin chemotactic receptor [Choloepus didactylus]XP_037701025.1 C3a anaphylatoxin chemotactic receptor [Choloepus didactylus]XP_037701026.1 C3a anaphylatoxin chemotactic receptor [Choloepus didactylus]XP_037701027.1 C3a anaphylatoxin chemotactic receptor [Choloepus didactylus]XP_037701028.1 C3a anaphylatoxin chemotactic receptor